MRPKITILMPCYNGRNFIEQAVSSVYAQTMADWELLISDDGSTDGTVAYLSSLKDQRVRVFYQKENLGIFGNLNFLFAAATGPITQLLCQDDYFLGPNALEAILNIWQQLPDRIVFLRCNHGRDGTDSMVRLQLKVLPSIIEPKDSDLYFLTFGCIPGNLSNISIRTLVVAQVGWFRTDLPFAGDFEFWSRTGRKFPWALNQMHVIQVRRHPGQASVALNIKGELVSQLLEVIETLQRRLSSTGYNKKSLQLTATVIYLVRHIDHALKIGLTGHSWQYLRVVFRKFVKSDCFLGWPISWLFYIVTGGGRWLGPMVAQHLISCRPKQPTPTVPV